MKTEHPRWILLVALLCSANMLMPRSDLVAQRNLPGKLTAEETPYVDRINLVATQACHVGESARRQTREVPIPRYRTQGDVIRFMFGIKVDPTKVWRELAVELPPLLPPPGLEEVHLRALRVVQAQHMVNELREYATSYDLWDRERRSRALIKLLREPSPPFPWVRNGRMALARTDSLVQVIASEAPLLCRAFETFAQRLRSRPPTPTYGGGDLRFRPRGTSVEVSASREGFAVEIVPSRPTLPTPIGDFSLGYRAARGVRLLTIVGEGGVRQFRLDRPFRVFVPASYGVTVSMVREGELTLEVHQRPRTS
jgi:hypothetical protein